MLGQRRISCHCSPKIIKKRLSRTIEWEANPEQNANLYTCLDAVEFELQDLSLVDTGNSLEQI